MKCGVLQKIWHGIYGRGEITDALRLRGLDLATGTKVAVCLNTAAAAYGFDTEAGHGTCMCSIPSGGSCDSTRGLVVHRREGAPLTTTRRTAGHHGRVDGDRGGPWPAAASSPGDAGRRAAQRQLRPRRDWSGCSIRQSGPPWHRQRPRAASAWRHRWPSRRWRARPGW